MKKQIVLTLITSALLLMAGTTQAGSYGYRGNHSGGYGGHYSGYGDHRGGYYGGRGYYRGGHSHLGTGLAIVAGAVVLGSIIQASSYNNRARQAQYGSRPGGPVAGGYWYRVDADGQCVEVRLNQQGREVWTYVDPSYCN